MKNWRTTLGGFLSAVGLSLSASANTTQHLVGIGLAALGTLIMGVKGADANNLN
jgi:hypothetical protein